MSNVTITNTSRGQLRLPKGPAIAAKSSVSIPSEDWEKKNSNPVVKAWLDAGALKVSGAKAKSDADASNSPAGAGNDGNGSNDAEREAEFRAMTNGELAGAIEKMEGGKDQLKSGMNKDELVALAMKLSA